MGAVTDIVELIDPAFDRFVLVEPPAVGRYIQTLRLQPRIDFDIRVNWAPLNEAFRTIARAVTQAAEALRPVIEALQRDGALPKPLPIDPKARALELRRTRNTGPTARQRAPRRIDPTRTRR